MTGRGRLRQAAEVARRTFPAAQPDCRLQFFELPFFPELYRRKVGRIGLGREMNFTLRPIFLDKENYPRIAGNNRINFH